MVRKSPLSIDCLSCGYSLSGLGESGECPECGFAFTCDDVREKLAHQRAKKLWIVHGAPFFGCVIGLFAVILIFGFDSWNVVTAFAITGGLTAVLIHFLVVMPVHSTGRYTGAAAISVLLSIANSIMVLLGALEMHGSSDAQAAILVFSPCYVWPMALLGFGLAFLTPKYKSGTEPASQPSPP